QAAQQPSRLAHARRVRAGKGDCAEVRLGHSAGHSPHREAPLHRPALCEEPGRPGSHEDHRCQQRGTFRRIDRLGASCGFPEQ
ncbi:unnamed protein product, partial [Effrenium voratum]